MDNLKNRVRTQSLVYAVLGVSGATTTSSVDMKDCRSGLLVINHTTASGDSYATLSIEDSDDDSTFAAVSPAVTVAIIVESTSAVVTYAIPQMKRYVRFKYTPTVGSTSYLSVTLHGYNAVRTPVV